jgi:hypothetical protein
LTPSTPERDGQIALQQRPRLRQVRNLVGLPEFRTRSRPIGPRSAPSAPTARHLTSVPTAALLAVSGAAGAPRPAARAGPQADQGPHHYYYREMYLPQVTSGPSAAVASPDGSELVSRVGSFWRARQYEAYPDGRRRLRLPARLVARWPLDRLYRHDAVELRLLTRSAPPALIADGGGNLAPSPDGRGWHPSTASRPLAVFVAPSTQSDAAPRSGSPKTTTAGCPGTTTAPDTSRPPGALTEGADPDLQPGPSGATAVSGGWTPGARCARSARGDD